MITVILDGKQKEIQLSACTLHSFIENEGLEREIIVVKVNGKYVLYEDHKTRYLEDGDVIEVEHVLLAGG